MIEISFSDGQYRLFLEFFAAGNIVLTDAELNVLALLRQVSEGDEDVDVKLGGKYSVEVKQNFHGIPPVTAERAKTTLEKQVEKVKAAQEIGGKKAKRNRGGEDLRKALGAGFPEYPPYLLEHSFRETNLDPATKPEDVLKSEELLKQVVTALEKAQELFHSFEDTTDSKGYIIAKLRTSAGNDTELPTDGSEPNRNALLYDDFHPFRPAQYSDKSDTRILELSGFNHTVDEFYSSIESQKLESRLTEREEAAKKKLQSAKNEHEKRLGALQQQQELHIRKAQTIEANTHRVEEAVAALNGLIGQGMDWMDIGKLIESEQGRGNVVAQMIKLPLKLYENTATLLLDEPGVEEESEDEDVDETDEESDPEDKPVSKPNSRPAEKRLAIDIDLGLSGWANARQYYDQKKTAAVKEQKTVQASTRALKSTEKKIEADLKKGLKQEKTAMRPARKQFWFEKFLYFISSDGYLVIGGKDAQQNEHLYRRYLKKGDIYVHADLQGASSVIVKNNPKTPDAPIPPSTLSQAGALTVCTSSAWDSKAVMAAWWVNADQVSKTAPTGEYLTTGGFMIRGKKNFLPPSQLLLGFGVLWLVSDDSRANHGKHRLERTESMLEGEAEALAADAHGLSVEDEDSDVDEQQGDEDVVPDVEEAAGDAAREVEEDDQAAEVEIEEDDVDDQASAVGSDHEGGRSNPLQTTRPANPRNAVEVEHEDEHTSDEEAGQDDPQTTDGEPEAAEPAGQTATSSEAGQNTTTATSMPPSRTEQKQLARGKRSKAKKARKKYAEQDEEDRALSMQLLGSARAQEKQEAAQTDKAARDAKAAADKERRRAQHARAAEAERIKQERIAKGEIDGAEVDEVDTEQLELERKEHMDIDLLVPTPEPGDEIMAAIPVVGPWGALGRCKYKVKLQPGGLKKGKAVREIVNTWSSLGSKGPKVVDENNRDKEKVWAREMECIKLWRVEEIVSILPAKGVRIVQSGGGGKGGSGGGSAGKGKVRGARGSKKAK